MQPLIEKTVHRVYTSHTSFPGLGVRPRLCSPWGVAALISSPSTVSIRRGLGEPQQDAPKKPLQPSPLSLPQPVEELSCSWFALLCYLLYLQSPLPPLWKVKLHCQTAVVRHGNDPAL